MRTLTLIVLCLIVSQTAITQTRVVKGQLTTFNTYAVQNVEVKSKKTRSAVVTDSIGRFELVCQEKDMIMVKTKVFEPLNRRVSAGDDFVTANLIFKDTPDNRAKAVGLGYIRADELSYALVHLAGENNDFCSYPDIYNLIRVKFPEVEVRGGPVGGQGVYIRGQKSFTLDTEAVYDVDGMRVSDISFIHPCEIAFINIMKSGGTAVYGTQAVNGVVLIKTKGN